MKTLSPFSGTGLPRSLLSAGKSRGYVLIVTLWVMMLLSLMLAGLSYQVRVETSLERRALEQSRLRLAARGAIHQASARLRTHATDKYHSPRVPWWSDESFYRNQSIGGVLVSLPSTRPLESKVPLFGLDDEESRLNVNKAEPEQLMGFPGISTVLAESIVRFRRERQENSGGGQGAGSDVEASDKLVNGPLRTLQELLEVEGVSEQLLFAPRDGGKPPLASFLTCTSSGRVNINSASEEVLTAVGFSEGIVNLILSQRRHGMAYRSLEEAASALNLDTSGKKWKHLSKALSVRSSTFRVRAVATLPGREQAYNTEATVYIGGETLVFARWREY